VRLRHVQQRRLVTIPITAEVWQRIAVARRIAVAIAASPPIRVSQLAGGTSRGTYSITTDATAGLTRT
jgi:hypothetical protein